MPSWYFLRHIMIKIYHICWWRLEDPLHSTFQLTRGSSLTAAGGWSLINIMIWRSKDCNLSSAIHAAINTTVDMTHQPRWVMCGKGHSSQPLQTVSKCLRQFSCMSKIHIHFDPEIYYWQILRAEIEYLMNNNFKQIANETQGCTSVTIYRLYKSW